MNEYVPPVNPGGRVPQSAIASNRLLSVINCFNDDSMDNFSATSMRPAGSSD